MSSAAVEYCPYTFECDRCSYDCDESYKMNYKIIKIDHRTKTAIVKGNGEAFEAKLCTYTKKGTPSVGDYAKVIQSHGEYMLVDYISMFAGGEF